MELFHFSYLKKCDWKLQPAELVKLALENKYLVESAAKLAGNLVFIYGERDDFVRQLVAEKLKDIFCSKSLPPLPDQYPNEWQISIDADFGSWWNELKLPGLLCFVQEENLVPEFENYLLFLATIDRLEHRELTRSILSILAEDKDRKMAISCFSKMIQSPRPIVRECVFIFLWNSKDGFPELSQLAKETFESETEEDVKRHIAIYLDVNKYQSWWHRIKSPFLKFFDQ